MSWRVITKKQRVFTRKKLFFSIENHLVGMQMADEFFIQNSSARTQKAQSEDCAFVMKPQ